MKLCADAAGHCRRLLIAQLRNQIKTEWRKRVATKSFVYLFKIVSLLLLVIDVSGGCWKMMGYNAQTMRSETTGEALKERGTTLAWVIWILGIPNSFFFFLYVLTADPHSATLPIVCRFSCLHTAALDGAGAPLPVPVDISPAGPHNRATFWGGGVSWNQFYSVQFV